MFPSPDPRIFCLLQSLEAHGAMAAGVAPPGLLSEAEQARCDAFIVPKRRRDWLLGRWTAKHLIQSYLARDGSPARPLSEIEILADDDGAPYAASPGRLPLSLSISHSGPLGFCALCPADAGAVGADVEQIEPRDLAFVRMFFTAAENRAVDAAPPAARDALITGLWSAKEAALKTLRLGLRADTRQVEIALPQPGPRWQPVRVSAAPALLPQLSSRILAWQQVRASYVLSLALLQP